MGIGASTTIHSDPHAYATPVSGDGGVDAERRAYDYVIVGGGTAGCVLASRLSEDPNVTVLLVEAGKSHEGFFQSRIPLLFTALLGGEYDWNFETTPQEKLGGRQISWPRGKVLGGSSTVNAVIYHHCAPEDFDAWAKEGATGWGYDTMRRYFRKAEKFLPEPGSKTDATLHGDSGLSKTRDVPLAPLCAAFVEACEAAGIPRLDDFNTDKGTLGAGAFGAFIDEKGQRSSAATAYLNPEVLRRPNLTVAVSATTERILFTTGQDGTPRATGIQLSASRDSPKFQVHTRKEVLLTAGAIGSAHLLMASGVGPAAHLAEKNIAVVRDSPAVGNNLYDHFCPGVMIMKAKPGLTWDYLYRPIPTTVALIRWLVFGTGVLATIAGQVGVFVRSDDEHIPWGSESRPKLPYATHSAGAGAPDVEISFAPMSVINRGREAPPHGTYGVTVGPILLKPESSGTVGLQSGDIWDKPIIDPNYLATQSDMNLALESMRLCLRLARQEPVASQLELSGAPKDVKFDAFWPTWADPDNVSDDDLKAWMARHGTTAWHPTSTVKMGPDPVTSAVDPELRVYGVRGLRVIDASVFPSQLSGHTCAVVIAFAERASDIIKETA
ncbi:hypothetical protein IEO21_07770 [Rhodonia placenta]|uniref:GMC oxidoreductase n=1 Tax=Rhodonia placenta TaxID=104341 RepID=A0A8H7TZF4_9APHY|nr:hypothetical protein IEO21_07770 [Postia placenta]